MSAAGIAARFTWHPVYKGRLVNDVRDELIRDLSADQRAWNLALEGAEEHEADALETVTRLEKRWADFDFGWAETDPAALADRVLAWEWERERRQELFPYSEMRAAAEPAMPPAQASWLGWLRRLFGGGR